MRNLEKKQDKIMLQMLLGNANGHTSATCSECTQTESHTRSVSEPQMEKEDGESQQKRRTIEREIAIIRMKLQDLKEQDETARPDHHISLLQC